MIILNASWIHPSRHNKPQPTEGSFHGQRDQHYVHDYEAAKHITTHDQQQNFIDKLIIG